MTSEEEMLAQYLEHEAWWRSEKADEYPEDVRNIRSAEALERAASWVRISPEARGLVRAVKEADPGDGDRAGVFDFGVFSPGEQASRLISQFGFHGGSTFAEDLLRDLAEAVKRDAEDLLRDLAEAEVDAAE